MKRDYIKEYEQGLITEEELSKLSPDDYVDLLYAEKAEIEKWAWLNQNLGVPSDD